LLGYNTNVQLPNTMWSSTDTVVGSKQGAAIQSRDTSSPTFLSIILKKKERHRATNECSRAGPANYRSWSAVGRGPTAACPGRRACSRLPWAAWGRVPARRSGAYGCDDRPRRPSPRGGGARRGGDPSPRRPRRRRTRRRRPSGAASGGTAAGASRGAG